MGATLDALHRLQEVELQLAELRRRIEKKQKAVQRQEKRIAELEAKVKTKEAALRKDQMETDRLDLDIKTHEGTIAKLRQVLNAVKTNKEYSAVLTQLNTSKADVGKLEERTLAMLNQLELRRKELQTIRDERAGDAARLEELKAAAKKVEDAAAGELAKFTRERGHAAEAVPAKALDVFNRVAGKHDGEAMALVLRTHPKREEYACEGCNMSITLEQVHAILARDEAVLCNTCGRILYVHAPASSGAR